MMTREHVAGVDDCRPVCDITKIPFARKYLTGKLYAVLKTGKAQFYPYTPGRTSKFVQRSTAVGTACRNHRAPDGAKEKCRGAFFRRSAAEIRMVLIFSPFKINGQRFVEILARAANDRLRNF